MSFSSTASQVSTLKRFERISFAFISKPENSSSHILATLSGSVVDILIYLAIGLVTVIGIIRCIVPVRHSVSCLRRAARVLEKAPVQPSGHTVWESELFMGRPTG